MPTSRRWLRGPHRLSILLGIVIALPALALAAESANRSDPATRAGALLRQARVLRKMGRTADAAAAYRQMAEIRSAAIEGVPADLVAEKALCDAATSDGRPEARRAEAVRLQSDLDEGRWRLDRATYEYVALRLDEWLGPERQRRSERELTASVVAAGGGPATVVHRRPGRIQAVAWTRDSRTLVFLARERNKPMELWQVPVGSGDARSLGAPFSQNVGQLGQLSVHPDGRHVAFTAGRPNYETWVLKNFLPPAPKK